MKFKDILETENLVLVDFFAEWCGPCKTMGPMLKQVKDQIGDTARIIKIDVDKNPGLSSQLQIQGVPTLILFKEGNPVWRQSGVVPVNQLVNLINEHKN